MAELTIGNTVSQNAAEGLQGVFSALAERERQRQERDQALQDAIALARAKAQIQQEFAAPEDPFANILKLGKVSEALSNLGIDPRAVLGQDIASQASLTPGQPALGGISDIPTPSQPTSIGIPQPGQTSIPAQTSAGGVLVEPTKFEATPFGSPKVTEFKKVKTEADIQKEARAGALKKKALLTQVQKSKLGTGKLVSKSNLELIAGTAHDLAQVYKKAFEEGGAGGAIQSKVAGLATRFGDIPQFLGGGEIGGKFSFSGSFPGKREELILKMMPMLTQQPTKPEGSVRLIQGVLDAIRQTIPTLSTAPKTAKEQLKQTILSFYRFSRAAELLNQEFDKVFEGRSPDEISDAEINSWAKSIGSAASRINLKPSEQRALEQVTQTALSPIDDIISPNRRRTKSVGRFSSIGQEANNQEQQLPSGASGTTRTGIRFTVE